jgi:hypothetical protein
VSTGCIAVVSEAFAEVINPIQVEINSAGKRRRVDDQRWPNSFLAHSTFRQETLKGTAPDIILKGDLMFSIDLKKAYYFVPMSQRARPMFCFRFKGVVYCPNSLMFGSSLGPMYFCKIARPILTVLQSLGRRCMGYVDDWLFAARPADAGALVPLVLDLFSMLGWVVNAKSHLNPTSRIQFLGMGLDSEIHEYFITPAKLERGNLLLDDAIRGSSEGPVTLDSVRGLTGFLQSQTLAAPPLRCGPEHSMLTVRCAPGRASQP